MKSTIKILFLFFFVSAFSQSPWTQEKGKSYSQVSFTTIPNYTALFGDPDFDTSGEITDNTIQLFGEYGLSDKTSLILNVPIKLISINNNVTSLPNKFSESNLGNIEFGLKHNFYNKKWLLSGQFTIEANTSSYTPISGIRTGYDAYTFTPLFLAGRSYEKTYIQGFIGANIRTNDYSSNFRLGSEVGHKISKRIWAIGFIDIVKSLNNGNIILPIQNTLNGLYVNDQEYGAFGLKGIFEFTDKSGAITSFGGAFSGNNVAKQAALSFGIYTKF